MIPDEIRDRLREFDVFTSDELGVVVIWVEGVKAIAAQGENALAETDLDVEAKLRLGHWLVKQGQLGHPRLMGGIALSFWIATEALVEDLFVLRLQLEKSLLEEDRLAKIKFSLAEVRALSEDERLRLLAARIDRGSKGAPGSFEELLGIVGLSGAVDQRVGRTLRELEQVRNVVVHRNGIADARLMAARFELEVGLGEEVRVTARLAHRYYLAVNAYATTILDRLRVLYERAEPAEPATLDDQEL